MEYLCDCKSAQEFLSWTDYFKEIISATTKTLKNMIIILTHDRTVNIERVFSKWYKKSLNISVTEYLRINHETIKLSQNIN